MRILFITSTRVGDAILSTGLLDHLITKHPGARITVACGSAASETVWKDSSLTPAAAALGRM